MTRQPETTVYDAAVEWYVTVGGDPSDLALLAADLRGPEPSIREEDGEYRIRSAEFAAIENASEVHALAESHLRRAADAVAAARRRPIRVELGSVTRVRPDGGKDVFVMLQGAITIRTGLMTATLTGGSPPTETPAEKVWRVGATYPQVATAARFLNRPATWIDLYKVYDALREVAQNEQNLCRVTGIPKPELVRFRRTADNMAGPAGEHARHAQSRHPPPPSPMALSEAEDLMWRLFHAYVDSIP